MSYKKFYSVAITGMVLLLHLLNFEATAQTDSLYWDFGTSGSATYYATFSSNANVLASTCIADTGNSGGGLASSAYTPGYLTNQFSSSGYTGATGEPTIRSNCKTGSLNASTSSFISFTITPTALADITIKEIHFGARRNGNFGPPSYDIRTSVDGYSSSIGSGSLSNGYGSTKESHTGLNVAGIPGTAIEIRIYAYSGFLTSTGGNLFLDDIVVYYDINLSSACDTPDAPTNITASNVSFYGVDINWDNKSSALTYEYKLDNSSGNPTTGTVITADSFYSDTNLIADTLYYFHVRSLCDTFTSNWETISFTTDTIPLCDTSAAISVSGITISEADISWNGVSGSVGYEYAVNTSATPPTSGTSTTDTFSTVTNLNDNTLYYVHLRTKCIEDHLNSGWITTSFTTIEDTTTDTFKVVTYNLLNYGGSGRETYYRTIMDSIDADIVVVQELSSSTGFYNFLSNVLNYSSSSYSAGTFINGYDTDNGLYYKSTKFQFINNTAISTSLRDINQFTLKHKPSGDTLIIYSVHLKAGSTSSDESQRAGEVDDLRTVTDALDSGKYFLVCGDFNIYGSGESAYSKLTQNGSNANGRFNDIISMTGTWNNSSYAIHHTQSPRTTSFGGGATGGLDDRFDLILFSNAIISTGGFDLLNGSYHAFGNDGQHYNSALNTPPYTTYPSTMLSAIHDASDHLPVVVQIRYNNSSAKPGKHLLAAQDIIPEHKLVVYPNPAEHTLFIKASFLPDAPISLSLYDMSGRIVKQAMLNNKAGATTSINVSDLAAGFYYLKGNNTSETHKVIIK